MSSAMRMSRAGARLAKSLQVPVGRIHHKQAKRAQGRQHFHKVRQTVESAHYNRVQIQPV